MQLKVNGYLHNRLISAENLDKMMSSIKERIKKWESQKNRLHHERPVCAAHTSCWISLEK